MKALKIVVSVFLTLIIIPIMMAFIVYLSANSIVSKKGIEKIVSNINVSNFLIDEDGNYNELGKEVKEELIKNGLPETVVDEFVNSKEITDFFTDYMGKVTDYIIYDKDIDKLTKEDISKLISDNIDSIIDDLRERKVEGYEELTDERVAEFKSNIDEISNEVAKEIPDVTESLNDPETKDSIRLVRFIFGKVVYIVLFAVITILLVLIALLNLKNYGFLIWYGVIFVLSSAPFVLVSKFVTAVTYEIDSKGLLEIINYVFGKLNLYSTIFFIGGILFIVIAVLLRTIDRANNVGEAGI